MTVPHDLSAEESLLCAAMLDEGAIEAGAVLLEGKEFYRDSHGLIWRTIVEMWRDGKPTDVITVARTLGDTLPDGEARLKEIATLMASTVNAPHYARIVRELWLKRTIASVLTRGAHAAENGMPAADVIEKLEAGVLQMRGFLERGGRPSMQTTSQLATLLAAEVASPPEKARGVAAPFRILGRLQPGRLYVLAGYTAHGKTVLGVQYVRAACRDGASVGVFSIEMTRSQLFDRVIAGYGIPLAQVESRLIAPAYADVFQHALTETGKWRAEINDDRSSNSATFRRWQKLRRYDLLVIDHLHEIDIPGRAADRRQNLETELLRIATVARDLEVPVLLLAQLSRSQGSQGFPKPTLAMLRETGRIEQVAAQVAFVYRSVDERGLPTEEAELIVAKDRFGPVGKTPLRFLGETVQFVEVDTHA